MKKIITDKEIEDLYKSLVEPFQLQDVEWRLQQSGKKDDKVWAMALVYVTNRAIMQRLDEVVGINRWKNEFKPAPDGGTLCGISIKFDDEWVTKWDGASNTQVEAVKGGLSGSMKRAAVQWGIGRYLYFVEARWAITSNTRKEGWNKGSGKDRDKKPFYFYWQNPELPDDAIPVGEIKDKGELKTITKDDVVELVKYAKQLGYDYKKLPGVFSVGGLLELNYKQLNGAKTIIDKEVGI